MINIKVLQRANIYSADPVMVVWWRDFRTVYTETRSIKALESAPGLLPHDIRSRLPHAQGGKSGQQASRPPVSIQHLFEDIVIALQTLAGTERELVRISEEVERGDQVIVPFWNKKVALSALTWTHHFLIAASDDKDAETLRHEADKRLQAFLVEAAEKLPPVQDRALAAAARARDIPCVSLVGRMIVLGQGRYQQRLSATKTSQTSVVGNDIAANKDYCRRVFADLGLPTPKYARVRDRNDAVEAAEKIGYPVVLKPNNGNSGKGVTIDIRNRAGVISAYRRARSVGKSVLVEEMVEGSDYRLLIIDGKFQAASKRVPGHVVGDGKRSIADLLAEVNSDPRRGSGPNNSWTVIKLDDQAERLIAKRAYTIASVPPEGDVVFLRRNANTSDGGTAVDVTDVVHPDNRDIAERAAQAIGLDIAGVDLLTHDISSSMWADQGKICEINSRPGIRKHIWPAEGHPRDVLNPILDMLFPKHTPTRIRIVALLRQGAADITAKILAHSLDNRGFHVGLAIGRQVFTGGQATADDVTTGPDAARRLILDPRVDVAVLSIDPEDILEHGLGLDAVDVAIAHSDDASSKWSENLSIEDTQRVFRVLASVTRRAIIVSADDDLNIAEVQAAGCASRLFRIKSEIRPRQRSPAKSNDGPVKIDDGNQVGVLDNDQKMMRIQQVPRVRNLKAKNSRQAREGLEFASAAVHCLGLNSQAKAAAHRSQEILIPKKTPTSNPSRASVKRRSASSSPADIPAN